MPVPSAFLNHRDVVDIKALFTDMLKEPPNRITGILAPERDLWQVREKCGPLSVVFLNDDFGEHAHGL
jgi:hypothetical protein